MAYRKKIAKENWLVKTVEEAKTIVKQYLSKIDLTENFVFGLPEVDDRYNIWRVPLRLAIQEKKKIGEIILNADNGTVDYERSTKKDIILARIKEKQKVLSEEGQNSLKEKSKKTPHLSQIKNTVAFGDAEINLVNLPEQSIDLVFTSPPYFNVRPEYSDYVVYDDYLKKMQAIIHLAHRVLNEGRFFVINISPVLLRRASRNEASRRIAVPFDFHRLFIEEGFDFVDDIIWEKPEGAGWATGRGRRFAADRNPMQYKPVPVTEYVLVYRKHTDKLIDWHIRKHPDQELVKKSKIDDPYEVTNIWKITPAHSKLHPAIFPEELAEKVIRYYSFVNDVILDPFGGSGTTAKVANRIGRRFVHMEINPTYIDNFKNEITSWYHQSLTSIDWMNTNPPSEDRLIY